MAPRKTPPRRNRVRITGAAPVDARIATRGPELPASEGGDQPPLPPTHERYVDQDEGLSPEQKVAKQRHASIQEFLRVSMKRQKTAAAAERQVRVDQEFDKKFAAGDQWDPTVKTERAEDERPALTINRIPQFMRQVKNQMRQARPSIHINPRAGGARPETAEVIQGLCKGIEVDSDAEVAYDTATDDQVCTGLGFIKVTNEWDSVKSWEQVIRIKRVRNPFTIFRDPSTDEFDFSDARWMHIVKKVPNEVYDARWGHIVSSASLVDMATDAGIEMADWMPEGYVVVAEYFYLDSGERELVLLDDGSSMYLEEYQKLVEALTPPKPPTPPAAGPGMPAGLPMVAPPPPAEAGPPPPPIPQIRRQRTVQVPIVKWCLHNAVAILEGNKDRSEGRRIPGTRIPIIPQIGDEIDLNGVVDYRGMVRDARDPQQMYNFWATSIAETVTLAPKAPWVVASGQIEEYQEIWEQANRRSYSSLPYDPVSVDGNLAPPPQRNIAEPPIQALVMGLREADTDLKAVMGLFEPSLGEKSPEHSGKAILARQQAGQIANSNFLDNQSRTIRSLGRLLVQWIPEVYDVARVVHIVMTDGKRQAVMVHSGQDNAPQGTRNALTGEVAPFQLPEGVKGVFDIGVGQFDVAVSVGPSKQSQRQETVASMIELFKAVPQVAAIGADLFLEHLDFEGAQQLAKRVKKQLPPGILDDSDPASELATLRSQMQQAKKQYEAMTQLVERQRQIIHERQVEAASKERIAAMQEDSARAQAILKYGSDRDRALFESEQTRFAQTIDHIHERVMQDLEHEQQTQLDAAAGARDTANANADRAAAAAAPTTGGGA